MKRKTAAASANEELQRRRLASGVAHVAEKLENWFNRVSAIDLTGRVKTLAHS